ncbi:MAG: hypothetical protein Q8L48_43655 [Archangium sp.]|nr:hypothetical protein [Archangium sp.]
MKYFILFAVCFSSVAFAQHRKGDRAAAREQAQPMPLAIGGSFFGKQPKLRSWVQGWGLTGTRPDAYEIRCDEVFTDCAVPILRTRAFKSEPLGMGSLTHSESAETWRGRRVELRAELRSGAVDGWAGLWMRVDGPGGKVLAFDNMQNRALRGTTSFKWYSVVLDVPLDAERVSFGVLLHGPGAVFVRELVFEEVDVNVSSTDLVGPLRAQSPAGGSSGGSL